MLNSSRIALGLSLSALPMLKKLKENGFVDLIAMSSKAAEKIDNPPKDLIVASAFETLSSFWRKGNVCLVIGAIGAVTRLVSSLVKDKNEDPAVLVLDSKALQVIPLLGGHSAGAEELAIQLANHFGGNVILTGDSSTQARLPIDSFGSNWGWAKAGKSDNWKQLMIKQSTGDKLNFLQESGSILWQKSESAQQLNKLELIDNNDTLDLYIGPKVYSYCCWHPLTLWVGIGCEKNTTLNLLERSLDALLADTKISRQSIVGIASIENKIEEKSIDSLAKKNQWKTKFFTSKELSKIEVPNPSKIVNEIIGCNSVAEASAVLAAGKNCKLIQNKVIFHSIKEEDFGALTLAIADSGESQFSDQGELHLVGSGPGDVSFLTNDSQQALSRCSVWIGYKLYLDLLEHVRRKDQIRIDSELTYEKDRCLKAVELAQQGVKVALISSGDSGIYGMAGLALELWLKLEKDDRPKFYSHPGLSAIQIAASRIGAPLMNDFCVLSLSDLLTPWEIIEKRLIAALKGDFVIAIYNPKSSERNWQLKFALDLAMSIRSKKTPVVLARQIGRENEHVRNFSLEDLPIDEVDMLSLVIIGNSQTIISNGYVITPRGYGSKSFN